MIEKGGKQKERTTMTYNTGTIKNEVQYTITVIKKGSVISPLDS
jgi:hypothetical protein